MKLTPFTSAAYMVNILLCTDKGLKILLLLNAIIIGAKLCSNVEKIEKLDSQSLKQSMQMRNFDNSFGGINGNLIVFTEAAGDVEPTECALNNLPPSEVSSVIQST